MDKPLKDIEALLEKAQEALRRDLNHIFGLATGGKLDGASARDLVAYTKLLYDIKADTKAAQESEEKNVSRLTDEELAAKAQALINESRTRHNPKGTEQAPK